MLPLLSSRRHFSDLSEKEILALAISNEEDDSRIYATYAGRLRQDISRAPPPIFDEMVEEEAEHRRRLIDEYERRFEGPIPLIRREHVAGYFARRPIWLVESLDIDQIRGEAARMERTAGDFYDASGQAELRPRYAQAARGPGAGRARPRAGGLRRRGAPRAAGDGHRRARRASHRQFVLTWVQPGLAGLMDGSVSTLAPIFATAFATQDTWTTFLVGLAASVGAGISMGFTEAASDDGVVSGRGSPLKRGFACGVMTTIGGLGHALPYLIPHFWTATIIALAVVFVELWAIAWIQNRYMETPFLRAAFQVVLGGALVLAAGILIGGG